LILQIVFLDNPGTMKKLRMFLEWILPLLRQYGATEVNTCAECGCELSGCRWILIDGVAYPMHSACAEKVKRDIAAEEEAQKQEIQGSYVRGAVGAFAGATLGAVAWAVVLMLGFVASLVGLLIGWLSEKGYTLLKGKQGKGKIVVLIAAIVFGVLIGTLGGYVASVYVEISKEAPGMLSFSDIPQLVEFLLVFEETKIAMIKDVLLGLLFAGLGVFALLRKAGKEVSGTKVIDLE
jgi:hypothetical protein